MREVAEFPDTRRNLSARTQAIGSVREHMPAIVTRRWRGACLETLGQVVPTLDGLVAWNAAPATPEQSEQFVTLESKAHAVVVLSLARPAISARSSDNLDAFIHLRALLPGLFSLDSAPEMVEA